VNLYNDDLPSDVEFVGSVAVDTEAMGLNIKRDRLCLVQMCSADGTVHMVQISKGHEDGAENLKKILTNGSILKIFHYARFDTAILNYTFGIEVNPVYCTKIASKIARTYTEKHGLKELCRELLGTEISKNEQTSDWGRNKLTPEQERYAAGDVLYLHALKEKLDEMLKRENRFLLAEKSFEAVSLIVRLELAGISPEELFSH
jgi:ribonuclease D